MEYTTTVLFRLPKGDFKDYVESSTVVPVGSTVYITTNADDLDGQIHGPYTVQSVSSDIRQFPKWTSQTVWMQLERKM